jgi:hypothetical protein
MSSDPRCPAGGRPEVAGWVLGGLDPDEALRFGEHLLMCGECQAAVEDLQGAGSILLATSAAAQPPADLERRTLARIRDAAGPDHRRRSAL